MKILQRIFIFSLLFYLLNCTCSSTFITEEDFETKSVEELEEILSEKINDSSASVKNCNSRQFSENEISTGNNYKCCFVKGKCTITNSDEDEKKVDNFQYCSPISKSTYNNLDKAIKELKKEKGMCEEFSVECSGSSLSYLYLVFILLILF